jgi:hypothetical protein
MGENYPAMPRGNSDLEAGNGGDDAGLLWLRYYIAQKTIPARDSKPIARSDAWIAAAAVVSLSSIFVLGRGITPIANFLLATTLFLLNTRFSRDLPTPK